MISIWALLDRQALLLKPDLLKPLNLPRVNLPQRQRIFKTLQ